MAMIVSGALVGAVNGLFYVFGRLPHPFIITLATLSICRGIAFQLADGRAIPGMPEAIRVLGRPAFWGLPGSVFSAVRGVRAEGVKRNCPRLSQKKSGRRDLTERRQGNWAS